jgi:hypothetical protein
MPISDEPSGQPATSDTTDDLRERAEQHAREAERLLTSRFISSHVKGQLHATLALYYLGRRASSSGTS